MVVAAPRFELIVTTIGLLGDQNLSYVTHRELIATISLLPEGVETVWIPTDSSDCVTQAAEADGLWAIPGTPYRNTDAVYEAITTARTSRQPFLGTCGGFQYAVVEFARRVAGLTTADHAEGAPGAEVQVVQPLSCSLVGQEREVTVVPDTELSRYLGIDPFVGYHYCNYGLADTYVARLERHGLKVSARAPDAGVEAIEVADHPFFIATLFQPQIGSLAGKPLSPLISAFCAAATAASTTGHESPRPT